MAAPFGRRLCPTLGRGRAAYINVYWLRKDSIPHRTASDLGLEALSPVANMTKAAQQPARIPNVQTFAAKAFAAHEPRESILGCSDSDIPHQSELQRPGGCLQSSHQSHSPAATAMNVKRECAVAGRHRSPNPGHQFLRSTPRTRGRTAIQAHSFLVLPAVEGRLG